MSCRASEPLRLGLAVLLFAFAACRDDVRRVDVCGRGDRAELASALAGGELELVVVDERGTSLASTRVSADGARAGLDVGGGDELRVIGRDAAGTTRADGQSSIGGGDLCVCLALSGQRGACAGLTCRIEDDRCVFLDAASGEPAGSREIVLTGIDTTLVASAPDLAHADEASLGVQIDAEVALLRFDTSVLPRTSVIEEASLELTGLPPPATPAGVPVRVVPVLEAWDETATWSQRLTGTAWTSPGCGPGSCADTPWAAFDPDRAAQLHDVPLGLRIAPWVSGEVENHGLALVGTGGLAELWSQEGQGSAPRLVVRYHMADDDLPAPTDQPICGNGLLEAEETCDDGDRRDDDACTNACQAARCGDGIPRSGVEDCDDGDDDNQDGCSVRCLRCADANAAATFVATDGRCYALYTSPRLYGIAENACDEVGHGTLAVFETRAEADAVLAGLNAGNALRWIGLSDRLDEGSFLWATGDPPAYDAFDAGEPASPPASEEEDCMAVSAGAWADRACGENHGFICERGGWAVDADGRGWLAVLGPTLDWDAAELECEQLDAHLAVISSPADQARVSALAALPVWLGLSERGQEGLLAWVTGEPLGDDSAFVSPPQLEGNTFCTQLDANDRWSVSPCFARRRYVCEAD